MVKSSNFIAGALTATVMVTLLFGGSIFSGLQATVFISAWAICKAIERGQIK